MSILSYRLSIAFLLVVAVSIVVLWVYLAVNTVHTGISIDLCNLPYALKHPYSCVW
jgi:hypothetical protein